MTDYRLQSTIPQLNELAANDHDDNEILKHANGYDKRLNTRNDHP